MPARAIPFITLLAAALLLLGCTKVAELCNPPPTMGHGQYGDKHLYRDITVQVRGGTSYYEAAAKLHRAHGYPLKPGITVRLPTLTVAAAAVGWGWLRACAFAVLVATVLTWLYALRGKATGPERLAAAALIAAGGAMLTGDPMILHERWAGLFLALALALRIGWREAWPAALAATAAALAVRELALPFVLLALTFAAAERRWREALGWGALIAVFAAFLMLHLHLVAAQIRPGDLTTQGWEALAGPKAAITAVIHTSSLQYLPAALAIPLAILPLLGWLGLDRRDGWFCLALFAGYALMFALFARPDNFYWGAVIQPAWFVGLAFLPHAAIRAWRTVRAKRVGAANLAGTGARL